MSGHATNVMWMCMGSSDSRPVSWSTKPEPRPLICTRVPVSCWIYFTNMPYPQRFGILQQIKGYINARLARRLWPGHWNCECSPIQLGASLRAICATRVCISTSCRRNRECMYALSPVDGPFYPRQGSPCLTRWAHWLCQWPSAISRSLLPQCGGKGADPSPLLLIGQDTTLLSC